MDIMTTPVTHPYQPTGVCFCTNITNIDMEPASTLTIGCVLLPDDWMLRKRNCFESYISAIYKVNKSIRMESMMSDLPSVGDTSFPLCRALGLIRDQRRLFTKSTRLVLQNLRREWNVLLTSM